MSSDWSYQFRARGPGLLPQGEPGPWIPENFRREPAVAVFEMIDGAIVAGGRAARGVDVAEEVHGDEELHGDQAGEQDPAGAETAGSALIGMRPRSQSTGQQRNSSGNRITCNGMEGKQERVAEVNPQNKPTRSRVEERPIQRSHGRPLN